MILSLAHILCLARTVGIWRSIAVRKIDLRVRITSEQKQSKRRVKKNLILIDIQQQLIDVFTFIFTTCYIMRMDFEFNVLHRATRAKFDVKGIHKRIFFTKIYCHNTSHASMSVCIFWDEKEMISNCVIKICLMIEINNSRLMVSHEYRARGIFIKQILMLEIKFPWWRMCLRGLFWIIKRLSNRINEIYMRSCWIYSNFSKINLSKIENFHKKVKFQLMCQNIDIFINDFSQLDESISDRINYPYI